MRGLHTALVAAALLASGCTTGSGDGPGAGGGEDDLGVPDGPPQEVTFEVAPGRTETVTIASNKGLLQGVVYTDAGSRLGGAHVSLVGTDFFADTDAYGEFRFVNVTPGTYQLNVVALGFQAHARELSIVAGQPLVIDVTLIRSEGTADDSIPHLHDYWAGKEEYLLLDSDYDFRQGDPDSITPLPAQTALAIVQRPNPGGNTTDNWWKIPILDGDAAGPAIVLPGTARMEVTVTWDTADVTVDTFGLAYRPVGHSGDPIVLGRQGTPATWVIDVNETQDDHGHQKWSIWQLWL
jgi:hypothetical protein